MRILIIGGSGQTGQLVIEEALQRGHTITALVRTPSSFPPHDGLTLVQGTPISEPDISAAFSATFDPPTAVIVTLGARRASASPFAPPSADTPADLMTASAGNVVAAMRRTGARKLVVMSAQGAGESRASVNFALRLLFTYSSMRSAFEDHDGAAARVREAGRTADVDFVIARPAMLVEGPAEEVRVFPDHGAGVGFMPRITRRSVARFLVEAVESERYDGTAPVITN